MFGRSKSNGVADAAETTAEYGRQLVQDEKARRRTLAAVAAAIAAKRRTERQRGKTGLAYRLATDPVLRMQLVEMYTQLEKARRRVEKRRSHKLRNLLLVTVGFGAVTAVLKVPKVRDAAEKLVGRGRDVGGAALGGTSVKTISEEMDVEVPVTTAYNQWTQFEQFPQFMDGVDEVRQLDDTLLHWAATVAGRHAEWDAKILEQEPDRHITWESQDGKYTRGSVSFREAGPGRTNVRLTMTYTAEGPVEQLGSAAGLDQRRIRGDLEKFKQLIENQGFESGGWRGEIHSGQETS
jgi:uncharacterized membrane protein